MTKVTFGETSTMTPTPTKISTSSSSNKLFDSTRSNTTGSALSSPDLRSNLMRELVDRDPLFYYQVVSILGVGSMGSVAKVKKRSSVMGGSARKVVQDYWKKRKQVDQCLQIPILGNLFRYCIKAPEFEDAAVSESDGSIGNKSIWSHGSSVLMKAAALVEDYNDGHGEPPARSGTTRVSSNGSSTSDQSVLYAMKSIHLSRVTDDRFIDELQNEISILRNLDHPHIVRPMETFLHRNQIFIVMELCTGGDLYARDPYTEEEAARITSSILSAIAYMHSRNICHRDLKYENILFVDNSPTGEIKLIDFGLSQVFGETEELTEGVGTIYTMSPEVLKGSYTKHADLWSVGVITYMLLSSQMPFYGRKREHIVEQIMQGKYQYKGRRWKRISRQAKDFVDNLLVVDPEQRATAEEALSASWLNKGYAATVRNPHIEEVEQANQSLSRFANYSKLKKVALMVVAHKSTSAEIGILRKVFQKYDTERNGILSFDEFKAGFDAAGLSEEDCRRMFDAIDLDGSGKIRYTEFLAATIEAQGAISEERLAEAFDRLDSDDSGYISAENLRELLGDDFPQEEIKAIIEEADIEKNGKVSYAEFLALWEDQNEARRGELLKEMSDIDTTAAAAATASSVTSGLSNSGDYNWWGGSDRGSSNDGGEEEENIGENGAEPQQQQPVVGGVQARATYLQAKNESRRKLDSVRNIKAAAEILPIAKKDGGNGKHVGFAVVVDDEENRPADAAASDSSDVTKLQSADV